MQNKLVELLAPAGNLEGFYGAICAGADAVYLGGNRFGARAYADNFTTEELISCIRYAHLWGRKVYLTLNTLIKENEFSEIYDYLFPFYEAGLDGVIIQDMGVLAYVKECFPDMELHVSTQMTLTGVYGAAMLKEMGACRIVPARELSLKEIAKIKKETGLSIETFIHGAMCYCYSGQCLFSSILGGRSGNRGRCAQPCRLPYKVQTTYGETEECYPLSLKDMCTIEHIPELIEAGIDSFKIEGRMKKPEYTAGVTAIYRKYIDKYYQTKGDSILSIDAEDLKALSCLYIRSERQDGYYFKHNGKDMVTISSPAYSGSDERLLAEIRQKYLNNRPKMSMSVYADFQTGKEATVTFLMNDVSVTVRGDVVQAASKQPISKENVMKQLSKLGDSCFSAENMEITVSEDAFYPLRAINELRRDAVFQLENAIITHNNLPLKRTDANRCDIHASDERISLSETTGKLSVSVRRREQLNALTELFEARDNLPISRIYVDSDLFAETSNGIVEQCRMLSNFCRIIITLPYIIRERDYSMLETKIWQLLRQFPDVFSGVMVRSPEGMGFLKAQNYRGEIYGDAGFYIWNRKTLLEWSSSLSGFCFPYELKSGEQRRLLGILPCEKVIYGRIPMMITANCIAKTTSGCVNGSCSIEAKLTDRYHKQFPVEINCTHCMNIIYNTVPLSLHGEMSKWKEHVDFRLDFTMENEKETKKVTEFFLQIHENECETFCENPPYKEYTTGHEKRGVE